MRLKELQLDNMLVGSSRGLGTLFCHLQQQYALTICLNDSTQVVVVSKEYLLKLIERLGKGELQEPGKFMFMPFSQTDDFLITLCNDSTGEKISSTDSLSTILQNGGS